MLTKEELEAFKKTLNQFNKAGIRLNRIDFNKICASNLEYNIFHIKYIETEGKYYIDDFFCLFSPLIQEGTFYIESI